MRQKYISIIFACLCTLQSAAQEIRDFNVEETLQHVRNTITLHVQIIERACPQVRDPRGCVSAANDVVSVENQALRKLEDLRKAMQRKNNNEAVELLEKVGVLLKSAAEKSEVLMSKLNEE
jgi:hypothetical protein